MSLQIKGKLTQKLAQESGTSKAGKEWVRQSFIIDAGDPFNPNIMFGLFGEDKIKLLDNIAIGQEIEVSFNLSSREHNSKWYTQADCWKVSKVGSEQPANENNNSEEEVDLPF